MSIKDTEDLTPEFMQPNNPYRIADEASNNINSNPDSVLGNTPGINPGTELLDNLARKYGGISPNVGNTTKKRVEQAKRANSPNTTNYYTEQFKFPNSPAKTDIIDYFNETYKKSIKNPKISHSSKKSEIPSGVFNSAESLAEKFRSFDDESRETFRIGAIYTLLCCVSAALGITAIGLNTLPLALSSAGVFSSSILVSKLIDKIKLTFSQVTDKNISYINVKDIIAKLGLSPRDHRMIYLLYRSMTPEQFQELLAELGFENKDLYFQNLLEKNNFDMSSLSKETLWGRSPVEQAYSELYNKKINSFANKIQNGDKSKDTLKPNEKRLLELLESLDSNMIKQKGRR